MTQMILARELARSLAGLTWVWRITSFAGGKSVGFYGSAEQKRRHLPAIAAGREKWAIGFTEPGGGTDVLGALRTSATRADGGWVINGQKTWSSMAHVADYILLLVRTTREVARPSQGVSLFILPTASAGVTIREIPKLGMRALGSCDVFLDDVFVPDENLLGEPDRAWKMLLPTLNNERIMLSSFSQPGIEVRGHVPQISSIRSRCMVVNVGLTYLVTQTWSRKPRGMRDDTLWLRVRM